MSVEWLRRRDELLHDFDVVALGVDRVAMNRLTAELAEHERGRPKPYVDPYDVAVEQVLNSKHRRIVKVVCGPCRPRREKVVGEVLRAQAGMLFRGWRPGVELAADVLADRTEHKGLPDVDRRLPYPEIVNMTLLSFATARRPSRSGFGAGCSDHGALEISEAQIVELVDKAVARGKATTIAIWPPRYV